jgi:capsular polysaccharide transport system permease protein
MSAAGWPAQLAGLRGWLAGLLRQRLFVLCVLAPTALAIIYYGLMASDVYVSESTFVVHTQETQPQAPMNLILRGAGINATDPTAGAVRAYILSRDALQVLDRDLHLGQSYADHRVDFFSRFARVPWHAGFEYLLLYYRDKVSVTTDASSAIMAMATRAFTADQAYAMNRKLLELTEALINKLNTEARADLIGFAAAEVAEAQSKQDAASAALARYRSRASVMDPERQAALQVELIARLQEQLVATRALIAQVQKLAGDNPQLPALRRQAQFLEKSIQSETASLAGAPHQSLALKAQEYSRLAVQKEAASTILSGAIAALETARGDARRKLVYLERIAQPSRPDVAIEPRRLRAVLATFLLGLILWGVASLLVAAVREHRH